MKTQVLDLNDVVFDKDIYPRTDFNHRIAYAYSQEMKAGVKFPMIVVAKIGLRGRYYLVDGKHRIEANRINGEKHIQAEVLTGLTKDDVYLESIKRNVGHGLKLSPYDKTRIILRLQEMEYDKAAIANLVNVPADKITTFVAKRSVSTIKGEQIAIKSPLYHLAGTEVENHSIENKQKGVGSNPQVVIINNLISLINGDFIDLGSAVVSRRLKRLYKMLNKMFSKEKKK